MDYGKRPTPFGTGQTKASHYAPLGPKQMARLARIRLEAYRASPEPLPDSGLGPSKRSPDPRRTLSYSLKTDRESDRNW